MSYCIRCDQCGRELTPDAVYWQLMPHRRQDSYSLADLQRHAPDLCSAACLRAWVEQHPVPEWHQEPGAGAV